MTDQPFWKTTALSEMSNAQWESLCDGCAKCCLVKLQDPDTDEIAYTNAACKLLDCETCRCKDYENRKSLVPDCVVLTPQNLEDLTWMPSTCAYRKLRDGEELPFWHPLVSGYDASVHEAGVSAKGKAVTEVGIPLEDLHNHIVDWPV